MATLYDGAQLNRRLLEVVDETVRKNWDDYSEKINHLYRKDNVTILRVAFHTDTRGFRHIYENVKKATKGFMDVESVWITLSTDPATMRTYLVYNIHFTFKGMFLDMTNSPNKTMTMRGFSLFRYKEGLLGLEP